MLNKEVKNQMRTYLFSRNVIGENEIKNNTKIDILLDTVIDMYEEDIRKNKYYILYKNMLSCPAISGSEEMLRMEFMLHKTFKEVLNLDDIESLAHTLFGKVKYK